MRRLVLLLALAAAPALSGCTLALPLTTQMAHTLDRRDASRPLDLDRIAPEQPVVLRLDDGRTTDGEWLRPETDSLGTLWYVLRDRRRREIRVDAAHVRSVHPFVGRPPLAAAFLLGLALDVAFVQTYPLLNRD